MELHRSRSLLIFSYFHLNINISDAFTIMTVRRAPAASIRDDQCMSNNKLNLNHSNKNNISLLI